MSSNDPACPPAAPGPGTESAIGRASTLVDPVPKSVDGLCARVILDSNDRQQLTFVRTTDARTALARGLQEYLGRQQMAWEGGRLMRFKKALVSWAEPEVPAEYPSLVLVGREPAAYDANSFTPTLVQVADGTKRYLRQAAEVNQRFELQLWSTDPQERQGLTAMVEDALEPAAFMTGLRLELPYYWGARATYEKLSVFYDDDAVSTQRRWRRSTLMVMAAAPQYRPVGDLQPMHTQIQVQAADPQDPSQPQSGSDTLDDEGA